MVDTVSGRHLRVAILVFAALFEGADNIALGLAAPKLAIDFGLAAYQIGIALSASLVGMMCGAAIGGRLADRFGRKVMLIGSMTALGVFSLATLVSRRFELLILTRFLAGAGLGGAFPILIALSSEISDPGRRARTISIVHSGQPVGGAVLSAIVALGSTNFSWQTIFWIGGLGPLFMALLLTVYLYEPATYRLAQTADQENSLSVAQVLFGDARTATTLTLWASCIFTLFVVYLLLNWLPSLMVAKGMTRSHGAIAATALYTGCAIGTVTAGVLADRIDRRLLSLLMYTGFALSLALLANTVGYGLLVLACALAGFFMLACQLILYASAAQAYPTLARGTGLGATIAIGRLGGIAAPITAGALLSTGYGASAVLAATIPCVVVAAGFAVILAFLQKQSTPGRRMTVSAAHATTPIK